MIVDPATGKPVGTLPARWIGKGNASAGGLRVAFVDPEQSGATVYDLESQKLIATVQCPGASVLALLDGGRTLAISDTDRNISVFDLATSRRSILRGHTGRVLSLSEFPGRHLLFSAGLDRTIRVWDLHHMEEIGELREHTDRVTSLLTLPDEQTLFSGSHDYSVRRWTTVEPRDLDRAQQQYWDESARLKPWVTQLLTESDDARFAVSKIDSNRELTWRQQQVAYQLLVETLWSSDCSECSDSASGQP